MRETLMISALAKRTGVPSKTLRYWEGRGLLPRASRTHTGYRMFDSESVRYVRFIRKAKAIGLTLSEMNELLRLARSGKCPCPEVLRWTDGKVKTLEQEIKSFSALLRRLKRIQRQWLQSTCPEDQCGDVCTLIDGLPEFNLSKGGKPHAKILDDHCNCADGPGGDSRTSRGRDR
ncbi:MAG: MerR family transcriptional regulator [Terriglobia bacterium]